MKSISMFSLLLSDIEADIIGSCDVVVTGLERSVVMLSPVGVVFGPTGDVKPPGSSCLDLFWGQFAASPAAWLFEPIVLSFWFESAIPRPV